MDTDIDRESYIRQSFFTNLLLLGFEARACEIKYRIPFNKEMFNLPNKTASEAVLYFLFERLNPVQFKEEFRCIVLWPISNKKDEQQFRKVCINWLISLQKEDPDSHLPRVTASLLMSPGGYKFYEFLFTFSNYVLLQVIKHENGVKSSLRFPEITQKTILLDDVICQTLQCSTIKHSKQYFTRLQQNLHTNDEWKEYSSELVKEYRHLTKKLRELEREVRTELQTTSEKSQARGSPGVPKQRSTALEFDIESQAVRRTQRILKLRDMWKQIERFESSERKDREIISCILDETVNKQKHCGAGIDATELKIRIPDLLLRECETEIHRRHVDNTYKNGQLNLVSVLQLWNLSLQLYKDRLQNVCQQNVESENVQVTTQLHTHTAHLANAQSLREKLSEDLLPQLKQSIQYLRSELDSYNVYPKYTTPSSSRVTSAGFELSSATPPLSFTPKDDGSHMLKHSVLSDTPRQGIPTPEAANQILDSISETSRKAANKYHHGSPLLLSSSIPVTNSNRNTNNMKQNSHHLSSKINNSKNTVKPQIKNIKHKTPVPSSSTVKSSTPVRNKVTSRPDSKPLSQFSSPQTAAVIKDKIKVNTPAKTVLPKSHNDLIDKIVSAVVDGGPDTGSLSLDINLENPVAALNEEVFISRDKIRRSPEGEGIQHSNVKSPNSTQNLLNTDSTRLKLSFTDDVNESLDETQLSDTVNNKNNSQLSFDGLTLDDEVPNLVTSPYHTEATSHATQLTDIFTDLGLNSVDADLDDIFNTKTPKISRKTGVINSLTSSFSDNDRSYLSKQDDSIMSGEPLTLVSFSPPKQTFLDDKSKSREPVTFNSVSPPQPITELLVDLNSSASSDSPIVQKSLTVIGGTRSYETEPPKASFKTDKLIDLDDEEFPDLLDLNESFAPIKEGIKLVGTSPEKALDSKSSVSSSNSGSPIKSSDENYRKKASSTLNRITIEIDDLIAETDKSIHEKEQQLLSTSTDDIFMDDLSRKYLQSNKFPTSHRSNNSIIHSVNASSNKYGHLDVDFSEDIFAEDDSILLPVSPNH